MKHYGDICALRGANLEPVDCIIGGSPCQGLSAAGKRKGLNDERSGLFIEQIRIIKEMREEDIRHGRTGQSIRPRYAVWENVPGAMSTGKPKGEDFRVVLEEFCRVSDPAAYVPRPAKGKWFSAGFILGDGWSLAWRIMDAQYFGVPQRRRRIALIADFGGLSAPEILFERESLPRDSTAGGKAGQEATRDFGAGAARADRAGAGAKGVETIPDGDGDAWPAIAGTLTCRHDGSPMPRQLGQICVTPYDTTQITSQANRSNPSPGDPCHSLCAQAHVPLIAAIPINTQIATRCKALGEGTGLGVGEDGDPAFTLQANHSHGVMTAGFKAGQGTDAGGIGYQVETAPTLGAQGSSLNNVPAIVCHTAQTGANGCNVSVDDIAYTLDGSSDMAVFDARGNGDGYIVPTLTGDHGNRVTDYTALAVDCINMRSASEISGTLCSSPKGNYSLNRQNPVMQHSTVRRLTPLECERLQGYPDYWTIIPGRSDVSPEELSFWFDVLNAKRAMDGLKPTTIAQVREWLRKPASDSARYKALGNSIALPPWAWVCERISAQYDRPATLGSLFDGIGGFPLIWERINGKGTALWASEIEPFCVAVTMQRFGDTERELL